MALHLQDVPPVEVALLRPDRPQALRMDGRVEPASTGFFGGPATLSGVLQLDALPPHETATPQLDAELVHRRGSARLQVRLSRDTGDRWEVAGELRLHGRGLLRLPVALSGPVLRHYVKKHAPEFEQALAESAGWRADTLRAAFGPSPSAAELADTFLDVALVLLREQPPKGLTGNTTPMLSAPTVKAPMGGPDETSASPKRSKPALLWPARCCTSPGCTSAG